MLCKKNTHICFTIFEILVVYVYILHRGQCINKGEGNVIPLGRTPTVNVNINVHMYISW
jgi:hypothetical protein